MFDIKNYLIDNSIEYFTDGKNVQSGWLNIRCPFCDDRSNHLGFNFKRGYFNCWKCGGHSVFSVIKKLTPDADPNKIISSYDIKYSKIRKTKKIHKQSSIIVPGEKLSAVHKQYLMDRGYNPGFLEQKYNLRGTNNLGDYKFRIIAPIMENNKIISYQGRDITGLSGMRYKACSKEKEIKHHKDVLYNLDNCKEQWVVVTEGIFKVWRLGNNSVATFGKSYTRQQLFLLSKFDAVFIFFDPDEAGRNASKKIQKELISLGVEIYDINVGLAPDDLSDYESKKIMDEVISIWRRNGL